MGMGGKVKYYEHNLLKEAKQELKEARVVGWGSRGGRDL